MPRDGRTEECAVVDGNGRIAGDDPADRYLRRTANLQHAVDLNWNALMPRTV